MSEPITVKHSFNAGDLITILPGFQKLYKETGRKAKIFQRLDLPADYSHDDDHPIKDKGGKQVCMNKAMFDAIKPLIVAQEYVDSFNVWDGEKVTFDFDLTRQNSQLPLPGGDIHFWATLIMPQLSCDLSSAWIHTPRSYCGYTTTKGWCSIYHDNLILINRTARYQIPYISYSFLKDYEERLLFMGTGAEHLAFCEKFKLNFPRLITDSFFTVSQAIADCAFFIGNQSVCWHIADAMKRKRILEVCASFPNVFPTGANGYAFVLQENLEHLFQLLINSK